jgi:lysophospholipase L1-like esterase
MNPTAAESGDAQPTPPTPLSRRKKLLFYAATLGLFLLLGLATEGILRLVAPGLKNTYFAPVDPDTGVGYTGGHPFSYNRFRMREIEFPRARPDGERRILCLGDSITFGYGLAAESAWPKVLQRRVAAEGGGAFCINASGTGATTHRQLEFYKEVGHTFGAELVIVGFCMNDVRRKWVKSDLRAGRARNGPAEDAKGLVRAGRLTKAMEWRQRLRRSYLVAGIDLLATEGTKRYIVPLTSKKNWIHAYPYQVHCFGIGPAAEQAWVDTTESLERLNEEVRRQGARLVVAAFPYQFQISDHEKDNPYGVDKSSFKVDPFDRLREIAARAGFEFVDLRARFAASRASMLRGEADWDSLYVDFCHPNAAGQRIAADAIYERLLGSGLLLRSTSR